MFKYFLKNLFIFSKESVLFSGTITPPSTQVIDISGLTDEILVLIKDENDVEIEEISEE